MRDPLRCLLAATHVVLAAAGGLSAQSITLDEALALAFPDAQLDRRTAFLDDAQLARVARLAGPAVEIESGIVTYYVALESGAPVGVAYFDGHNVRSLPEVLMFVVGPEHRIHRTEVVSFHEPPEYRAPERWLAQFQGEGLGPELSLKGAIAPMTGATLTARAATAAARRVMALHQVIAPFGAGAP